MKKTYLISGITIAFFLLLFCYKFWFDQVNQGDANLDKPVDTKTEGELLPDYHSAWEDGLLTEEDIAALDGLWEKGDQHVAGNHGGLTLGLLADDTVLQDFPGRLPVVKLESIVGEKIVSVSYIRFGEHVEYYAVVDQFGNGADIYYNTAADKVTFFNIGFNHNVLQYLPKKYSEDDAMGVALEFLKINNVDVRELELRKNEYIDMHREYWFEWTNNETLIQVIVSSTLGRVVIYTATPEPLK
jgi:hypothetical protein